MKLSLSRRAKKFVQLSGDSLLRAGASSILAIDAESTDKSLSLLASEPEAEPVAAKLGVVRIEGPLAQRALIDACAYVDGYDAVTSRLEAALAHPQVGALLLVIDSPGGDVAGLEESIRRMRAIVEESGKPVVAYVDELAASAAYWIAAGVADEIHVPVSGRVGSIGCIGAWVDTSEAQAKAGIKWHVVRDPAGKDERNPMAAIGALADERLTDAVRSSSSRFAEAVAQRRGLETKAIRALNAAVLSGPQALEKGLADVVGSLEGAADRALALSSKRKNMKLTASLAALCGLPADAAPEAVEASLDTISKDILAATGAKSLALVPAQVETIKALNEANAEKAAEYDKLTAKLATDAATAKAARLQSTLDAAVKAGKITPIKRADYEAKASKYGVEWLEDLVAELPVKGGTEASTVDAETKPTVDVAITGELAAMLERAGLTADDYRAAVRDGVI